METNPDIKKIAELQNEIRELTEEREWMARRERIPQHLMPRWITCGLN
jgi:hypothetical protein